MRIYVFQSLFLILVIFLSASCRRPDMSGISIAKEDSLLHEGKVVELFRLTNRNGMTVKVTNFAASLVYATAPDRNGLLEPVVLGLDSLRHYLGRQPKLGATVGRFANRIKDAEFRLDGNVYRLEKNSKEHSIHGGSNGFNQQVFETDTCYVAGDTAVVVFRYFSPDMEGGFPGNLNLTLAYKLTADNEIILDYTASTDKPTVVNLTNHSYFNLTGCKKPILNHYYRIEGDSIASADSAGIPTGRFVPVAGTDYDFTTLQTIGQRVGRLGRGYDTSYKFNKAPGVLALVAKVVEPVSGRVLTAYTTEPGMQFYTPAADLGYLRAAGGLRYGTYFGFCLEMQHFPDSPHHPQFPSTVLLPGKTYRQITVYKFEILPETN